mgnify:CR=1 FL=1
MRTGNGKGTLTTLSVENVAKQLHKYTLPSLVPRLLLFVFLPARAIGRTSAMAETGAPTPGGRDQGEECGALSQNQSEDVGVRGRVLRAPSPAVGDHHPPQRKVSRRRAAKVGGRRSKKQGKHGTDDLLLDSSLSLYPMNRSMEWYQHDKKAQRNPILAGMLWLRPKLPAGKWLPSYSSKDATGDIMAGVTVGLMVVPQALAYATIANLPYEYGLFSSFMGVFVYCLLGTSRDVSVGPTAIVSLLVAVEAQVGH